MMEPMEIEAISCFADARGVAFEPVNLDMLTGYRNVHVVLTEPGHVRGNHRHLRGTEHLVVRGPALLVVDDGTREEREVAAGEILRVTLRPGVAHAVKNTGEGTMLITSFGTESFDPTNTERVVLL